MRTMAAMLATTSLLGLGALAGASEATAHSDEAEEDHHEESTGGEAVMHKDEGHGEEGHGEPGHHDLEDMREMHRQHEHEHDFSAMDHLEPEQRQRVLALMRDVGLALPPMDPERGRTLFLEKGCVACHSINDVGGDLGPSLNANEMPEPMNTFEFAARMWRGAPAMTDLQEDLLGDVITLDGQELADIIAFAHDEQAQAKLSADQVPEKYHNLLEGE